MIRMIGKVPLPFRRLTIAMTFAFACATQASADGPGDIERAGPDEMVFSTENMVACRVPRSQQDLQPHDPGQGPAADSQPRF